MKKSPAIPRWWDWTAIVLLFILLDTLATRLISTSWTPFLSLTQLFVSLGFLVGASLGYSQFRPGTARWLSFFYMLIFLPLQWTRVIDQKVSLEEQLSSVGGRLLYSISELLGRRPVEDPLFFVAVMSLSFWIISASAGFSLTRYQNYLRAIIPSAVGILVIQHYDNTVQGRVWMLGLFTFIALLLMGRLYFLQNRTSWQARRVFVAAENNLDIIGGMVILAGVVVFASFTIPATRAGFEDAIHTWNRITQPWRDFTEKLDNAVSALDSPNSGSPGEFYGTELPLGRGFPLSEAIMFQVDAPEIPDENAPPRYYWRGRAYDYYSQGQWLTTGTTHEQYSPSGEIPALATVTGGTQYRYQINVGETRFALLYAPSQPVWVSRPGSFLAVPADGEEDIISWNASPSLLPGENYEVRAVVKNPNIQQLREAGTDYPGWVTRKYLQLPDDFSLRVFNLAEQIAAGDDTPYDKAVAVTQYLRTNIKYAPTVPLPPRNRDPLEWLLFEHKEAYCVYYATSEVLMLRSLGIPARLAVGFAEGTPITTRADGTDNGSPTGYIIQKKDAHAWPEVYFPNIGWVEFEPTGNQIPLDRPTAPLSETDTIIPPNSNIIRPEDENPLPNQELPETQNEPAAVTDSTFTPSLYLITLLIIVTALTISLGRRYNISARIPVFIRASIERSGAKVPNWVIHWEQWTTLSPIEKAFDSINFGLRQLKQPAPIHATPLERAKMLTEITPQIAEQIKVLLDEHQTSLYTSRIASVHLARRAAGTIRRQILLLQVRYLLTGTHAIES